jgi:hypothetical protein
LDKTGLERRVQKVDNYKTLATKRQLRSATADWTDLSDWEGGVIDWIEQGLRREHTQ